MDQFVQDQLRLIIGCDHLIPVFRDKGYNEESFRNLGIRTLMDILPIAEDEDVALRLSNHIKSLRDPVNTSNGHFPPPNVIMKAEPGLTDDDDVEIVKVTIRAPSGFTRVEVKQEISGPGDPVNSENVHEPSASCIPGTSRSPFGIAEANPEFGASEINPETTNTNGSIIDPMESHDGNRDDEPTIPSQPVAELNHPIRRSSRKRQAKTADFGVPPIEDLLRAQIGNITVSSRANWNQITTVLAQMSLRQAKKYFKGHLKFVFSTNEEFDQVVELLEAYTEKLAGILQGKGLELATTWENTVILQNDQIARLAELPDTFFSQLISLTFYFGLHESTDLNFLTAILSKCYNLKYFTSKRGLIGTRQQFKSITIPKMDKLIKFEYAHHYMLSTTDYDKPPTPAMVDEEKQNDSLKFQVDFGDNVFPELKSIMVAPFVDVEFKRLAQFPNLREIDFGIKWKKLNLDLSEDESIRQRINHVSFPPGIDTSIILQTPQAFKNLTSLQVLFATFGQLRALVRVVGESDLKLTNLALSVSFEFESALSTGLRGLPYQLITESDKLKLAKMKRYKHWKSFLDYLQIEIPEEELEDNLPSASGAMDIVKQEDPIVGIGSFKHLTHFMVGNVPRYVHIPRGDLHWNNPEVELSTDQWSSNTPVFPTCVLLDQLTKLKGKLVRVVLRNFTVEPDTSAHFHRVMGFKPIVVDEDDLGLGKNFDYVSGRDSMTDTAGPAIKRERN